MCFICFYLKKTKVNKNTQKQVEMEGSAGKMDDWDWELHLEDLAAEEEVIDRLCAKLQTSYEQGLLEGVLTSEDQSTWQNTILVLSKGKGYLTILKTYLKSRVTDSRTQG